MAVVSIEQMIAAEKAAIDGIGSEAELLLLAGTRLGHAIGRFAPGPATAVAYLGKGHNAGDALVALQVLRDSYSWDVSYRLSTKLDDCAPLVRLHAERLGHQRALPSTPVTDELRYPLWLIDGLLGTGARGEIRSPMKQLAAEMNRLRDHAGARIAAVDIPTGVDADSGHAEAGAVVADVTFMIGNAKQGLVLGLACKHTGALRLVPVECLSTTGSTDMELICPQAMHFAKSPRPHDTHKGMAGRVSLLVGSHDYPGAAVIAATGALRGGAGLVTLHLPRELAREISRRCPAEVIIREFNDFEDLDQTVADAWVMGCGLGTLDQATANSFFTWLSRLKSPAVIDADALNLIARHGQTSLLQQQHVLTPHPGEFKRLAPDLTDLPRESAARSFAQRHPATLLLKGARTLVTAAGHPLWINSTGNAGMATGGQGDLLAGVIGSHLAAGLKPTEAAALAAWLCGRAAEIAVHSPHGPSANSLLPLDLAQHLGQAGRDWCMGSR